MAWKFFSRSDRNDIPRNSHKPPSRARRLSGEPRPRRPVVEQLEERALLALTAFPTGQFGAPPDIRMSEGYWEALNLAELGRAAEIPGPVAPTSNSGGLGYTIDQVKFDPQLGLNTDLQFIAITAETLNFLSAHHAVILNSYTPPTYTGPTDTHFWSHVYAWIQPEDVDAILQFAGLEAISFPAEITVADGASPAEGGGAEMGTVSASSGIITTLPSSRLPGTADFITPDVSGALQYLATAKADGSFTNGSATFDFSGDGRFHMPVSVSGTGKIRVQIEFAAGDSAPIDAMRRLGVDVSSVHTEYGIAEAWVDADDLVGVSAVPGITRLSLPDQLTPQVGSYTSEASGYTGSLTTRTSDTGGQITVSAINGVTTANPIDIYWMGGRRTGVTVVSVSPGKTIIQFSGGTGDILPALNTTITIDSSLKIQRVLDQFRAAGLGGAAIDGTGIKIGVISSGDLNLQTAKNSGDLPSNVVVRNDGDINLAEGTAMMEIIHDIAPGAQLYFYGATDTLGLTDGITDLQQQGVNIIVDDEVSYYEPYFIDGPIAQQVQAVVGSGIIYVTAAGNAGVTHYQAPASIDPSGFQNFNVGGTQAEYLNLAIPGGTQQDPFTFDIYMEWSDDWNATPTNNFGLYLYDSGYNLVAASTATTPSPFRTFEIQNSGPATTVRIQVSGPAGTGRELELFAHGYADPSTFAFTDSYAASWEGDALISQEAVPGVVAVGAINAVTPENSSIASYSDHGPSTIYTNFATQSKIRRPSSGITAIDGVDTETGHAGAPDIGTQFYGTSAAAPDVAAIAALMLQEVGAGNAADVRGAATRTGNTTNGSTTISGIASTSGLAVGMSVGGIGIPGGASIVSISANSITISAAATATGSGVYFLFGALNVTATDLTPPGGSSGYDNVFGAGRANALDALYRAYTAQIPDLLTDNGQSTTDNVTSATTQTMRVTAPPGSYIQIYRQGLVRQTYQMNGNETYHDFTVTSVPNGFYFLKANVMSSASDPNVSLFSPTLVEYTDQLATYLPSTAPDLDAASDTGLSSTDNLTTVTTPTFTGNVDAAAAGAIVTLWIDGVQKKSQTLAAGTTAYSLQSTVLGAGNHTAVIRAQMYSASPSSSFYASPSLAFTIDDGTAPVATIAQCGSGATARNGSITPSSATVTNLSGTADLAPGMTISGAGIPAGTTISSIASSTSIVMSANATAGGVSTLSFGACPVNATTTDFKIYVNFNKPVYRNPTDLSDLKLTRVDVGTVASAVSSTQFNGDSSFASLNGFYNGRTVRFTSGSRSGQSVTVTGYTGSTRTFQLGTGLSGAPGAGDAFQIDSTVATGTVASAASATQFNGNSALAAFDDYYNGRLLKFTSGVLNGQSQKVRDYVGATRTFTFLSGFTATPSVNETFTLDDNRVPLSTMATASQPSSTQWIYSGFFDIQMTSGKYSFSINATNNFKSAAGDAQASVPAASVWSQTDGSYQNGGKAEGPSQTAGLYYDVDRDGVVAPTDQLVIINLLNGGGGQPNAATWCASNTCNPAYYDVNNDGYISPVDALIVGNYLNTLNYNPQPPGFTAAIGGDSGGSPPPPDLQPADVTVNVQLQATDVDGTPLTSVNVGQQFEVRAYLLVNAPSGVLPFAGYADTSYPKLLVTPTSGVDDSGLAQSTIGNGLIDEGGQIMNGDPAGLMFIKTFTATKSGTATFAADAADLFGHEIYVTGLNTALPLSQITFGNTILKIKP